MVQIGFDTFTISGPLVEQLRQRDILTLLRAF
jgi:hypothetical protein